MLLPSAEGLPCSPSLLSRQTRRRISRGLIYLADSAHCNLVLLMRPAQERRRGEEGCIGEAPDRPLRRALQQPRRPILDQFCGVLEARCRRSLRRREPSWEDG